MKDSRFLIVIVILTVVLLLNLPLPTALRLKASSSDNIAPFQNGWAALVTGWGRTRTVLADATAYTTEKVELEQEIASLKFQLQEYKGLEERYENLKKLMEFKKTNKRKLVLCEVVARGDTVGWWQSITLNKGAADGILPNRAVITKDGLIGTTQRVSKNTTEVLLIMDPHSQVACKFERTGVLGILRGKGVPLGGDPLLEMLWNVNPSEMTYIQKDHQLIENDQVVTSGLGGVYPEGLVVGFMSKIRLHETELYYCADITLAADFNELKYVFIVN